MKKIISFLLCCTVASYSFAQPSIDNDSNKLSPVTTVVPKNNSNLSPSLSIYPNPAKNKITLQVKNFAPGMATVKVLNIKGQMVREDTRLLTNGNEDIVMFLMLKAGIYFLQVSESGKITRKKLIIL